MGTVGIIGNGTVGGATARVWMEHAEVKVYDTEAVRRTHPLEEVAGCDVVFVCVPTPQTPDGLACDLSVLESVCQSLSLLNPSGRYALRSTVPVGTTSMLAAKYRLPNLVHSPEFLTARCAATDAHLPSRNVIGSPPSGTRTAPLLRALYQTRFPGVPLFVVRPEESELIKLATNAFFAVKVAFFNEARSLSDYHDLDWDSVLAGVLSDGRISHSHVRVPGPDGRRGFGGVCLPKDLANFASCLIRAGLDPAVSLGALTRNSRYDRPKKESK